METVICASNPTLYLSKYSPWKPKIPVFHPRTIEKLNYPLSTLKRHANSKGFPGTPATVGSEIAGKKPNRNKNEGNDEIPREVFNRMIARILVSVGVPMGLGLAFLHIFGVLKEQQLWDVPMWLPFLTTFVTFGASALGIAYGTLSTSLDAERKGSFLGVEEVQRNWVEMWKEEDESRQR